jgi:hypothetical protein
MRKTRCRWCIPLPANEADECIRKNHRFGAEMLRGLEPIVKTRQTMFDADEFEKKILKQRDAWARQHARSAGVTIEAARAAFWRENPGAQEALRAAGTAERKALAKAKAAGAQTLRGKIESAVQRQALLAQLQPGQFTVPIEKLRSQIWQTEGGKALAQLARSPLAERPAELVVKSDEYRVAWMTLDFWETA